MTGYITDLPVPHVLRADAEFPVSGDALARLLRDEECDVPSTA